MGGGGGGGGGRDKECLFKVQWRNQIWQSLEEGAGKRCSASECESKTHTVNALSKIRQNHSFEYQTTTMTVVLVDHLLSHSQAHILLLCEKCGLISDVM